MESIGKMFQTNKVKILGGDLTEGEWEYSNGTLWGPFEHIETKDLLKIEQQTQESVKQLSHTLGWTFAGLITFGPLGAFAGAMLGGNRKQICCLVELKDGRKFLALMDSKIYQELLAHSLSK